MKRQRLKEVKKKFLTEVN